MITVFKDKIGAVKHDPFIVEDLASELDSGLLIIYAFASWSVITIRLFQCHQDALLLFSFLQKNESLYSTHNQHHLFHFLPF